jgi:hypothetical protein
VSEHDEDPPEQPSQSLEFYVPEEQEEGTYANTVAVWHTAYDFVIDFGLFQLVQPVDPDNPEAGSVVPARVASRVRIPAGLVFDLIRTINARMEAYESEWGEIRAPEPREQEGEHE